MANKNKERGKYSTLNIAVVCIREVGKSNTPPRQASAQSVVELLFEIKRSNIREKIRGKSFERYSIHHG